MQNGWAPPPGIPPPQTFLVTQNVHHPGFNLQFVTQPMTFVPLSTASQINQSMLEVSPQEVVPSQQVTLPHPGTQHPLVPAQISHHQDILDSRILVPHTPVGIPVHRTDSGINLSCQQDGSSESTSGSTNTSAYLSNLSSPGEVPFSTGGVCSPPSMQPNPPNYSGCSQTSSTLGENSEGFSGDLTQGTNIPKVVFDWDYLIKTHEETIKAPDETKAPSSGGVSLHSLLKSGRRSFMYFVDWIKLLPMFTELPPGARKSCLGSCWISQAILNVFYRTFICSSSGNIVMQNGLEVAAKDIQHPLMAMGISKMQEAMGTFMKLQVDYKEFLCLRLLCLFNPGKRVFHVEHVRTCMYVCMLHYIMLC